MTTCEFSRKRSKTICFPSLVTSKVRMAARFCSLVRGRDFMEARFGCDDGIGMLVESHVARSEELGELGPVFKAIKTAGPADENVYTEIWAGRVSCGADGLFVLRRAVGGRDGQGDSHKPG